METRDPLTHAIIGAAIEVHKEVGPGLLEKSYSTCLARELALRGISHQREVILPIQYKDVQLEEGYRLDFLVEDKVVVELKAVEQLHDKHKAQCLTYLRHSGKHVCLLINFNEARLIDGIERIVL